MAEIFHSEWKIFSIRNGRSCPFSFKVCRSYLRTQPFSLNY